LYLVISPEIPKTLCKAVAMNMKCDFCWKCSENSIEGFGVVLGILRRGEDVGNLLLKSKCI